MWNEIYVEEKILSHPRVQMILAQLKRTPLVIGSYRDFWGRFKKPYLHKRDTLNLFLSRKEGQLLKLAPDAYGSQGDPHYYFIHAYNCIYECEYCYLQGHFNTPDIVLFVNHEDIILEMKKILSLHPGKKVWFHAGEFSDSLALSHLTQELELYHEFTCSHPEAILELRTKSVNIRELLKLPGRDNFIVSYSLSTAEMAKRVDLKTPSLFARLESMKKLKTSGHALAAHFDPIIYEDEFKKNYTTLLKEMEKLDLTAHLKYLSLGVVRFTKEVFFEVEKNYPHSLLHTGPVVKSFDGKVRYHRPMRMWMMNTIKELAIAHGVEEKRIYLCMEDGEI